MQKNKELFIWLICLTIFLIPSNLFLKFSVNSAYVHGLLIDYLLPKLYVSDLPILAIFILWFHESWKTRNLFSSIKEFVKAHALIFLVGSIFLLRQFFADDPIASLWFFAKLCEMSLLGIFLFQHRSILSSKKIYVAVATTLLFQSIVGIYQFFFQHSLFPSYLFFGEPNLTHSLGLAKTNFGGELKILPYGTTTHPNVLAGFLVSGILILLHTLLYSLKKYDFRRSSLTSIITVVITMASIALSIFTVILTQSLSAGLFLCIGGTVLFGLGKLTLPRTFLLGILCTFFPAIILTPILIHYLLPLYPDNPSIIRREVLNQAAGEMFIHHPVFGVGFNNFTIKVEKYASSNEVVRFVQPAHHIFLLWGAETGALGLFFIAFIIFYCRRHFFSQKMLFKIFSLLPLITLDHYLLTQQIGLLIVVFFFTLL